VVKKRRTSAEATEFRAMLKKEREKSSRKSTKSLCPTSTRSNSFSFFKKVLSSPQRIPMRDRRRISAAPDR
jgi:hypothetical protein